MSIGCFFNFFRSRKKLRLPTSALLFFQVLLYSADDLRMEEVLQCLFVRHVHRVLLQLLTWHGESFMKEAIDLCELMERYGDEQSCRNYLEHLRWRNGVRCPKCNGEKVSSILKRDQYNCDNESCRYSS